MGSEMCIRDRLATVDADILIVGHTHQVYHERLGDILVINPGSTPYNYSCMILSLPACETELFGLLGKEVRKVWNWGMLVRGQR